MEWSDSSSINMSNVVRKCGTLSSILFNAYMDEYHKGFKHKILDGCHIGNIFLVTLCHADNIFMSCQQPHYFMPNTALITKSSMFVISLLMDLAFCSSKRTLCVIKGTNIFRKALTCILAGEVQMGRLKRHMCYLITLHLRNDHDIQLKKGNYVSSENRFWVQSLKIYLKAMMFPQNYFKHIALHFMAVSCGIQLIFHWYIIAWNKAVRRIFHFPHITHRCLFLCVVNSNLICVTMS